MPQANPDDPLQTLSGMRQTPQLNASVAEAGEKMEDSKLAQIRERFASHAKETGDFRSAVLAVLPGVNAAIPNADNWQMVFDLLHWDWCGLKNEKGNDLFAQVHPNELDKIAKQLSPYGEQTEAIIEQQITSADAWRKALEECDLSPEQALGLARQEAVFIAEEEHRSSAIATSPSPISIPIEIVRLYRDFYRAANRYRVETTNALKPLLLAKEVIGSSSSKGLDLELEVTGRIVAFMRQVRASTAKGRWVIPNVKKEHHAIQKFSTFMVQHVLGEKFKGDKAAFSSKRGIGLIEDACLYLYILEAEKEQ